MLVSVVWFCSQNSSCDEENSESQEVLEELIVRHLTREYLDFLGRVLSVYPSDFFRSII